MAIGVVIGRFQTPFLHEGHVDLLREANKNERLVVLVGCASVPFTKRNPLDFSTRELMIRGMFPDATIMPVFDQPSNESWSKTLDRMLEDLYPFQKIFLYHGRDSFRNSYTGKLETKEVNTYSGIDASGLREKAGTTIEAGQDFRHGIIYASQNSWPRVIPTVDIACWRKSGRTVELLLGRKNPPNGGGKLCLIGGHVNIDDVDGAYAARRELNEETGLTVSVKDLKIVSQHFIGGTERTGNTRILTTLYSIEVSDSVIAIANDDIDELEWVDISDLNWDDIYTKHWPLIEAFEEEMEERE